MGLEVTAASEGLNSFSAAHFMPYYCCQKEEARTKIEQYGLKTKDREECEANAKGMMKPRS